MGGEFHEALETLRDDLKKELKYHVGCRLFFGPDGIVKLDEILNNRQFLQEFFEKFIQREKNRILFKIREVRKQKMSLGDIERKLRDIEQEQRDIKKPLDEIKKKWRELGDELDELKEYLINYLRKQIVGFEREPSDIALKNSSLLWLTNARGWPCSRNFMRSESLLRKVAVTQKQMRILEEYLEGLKRDAYCDLKPRDLVNVGLVSEDICRLIEPYYVKYEHIIEEKRRLDAKEKELKEQKRILLRLKEDLLELEKKLKKIELIEAQRDMNKIQEFIKDLIREIRGERVNEWEIPDHYIFGDDDVLS